MFFAHNLVPVKVVQVPYLVVRQCQIDCCNENNDNIIKFSSGRDASNCEHLLYEIDIVNDIENVIMSVIIAWTSVIW